MPEPTINHSTADLIAHLSMHNAADKFLGKKKSVNVKIQSGDLLILQPRWQELRDKAIDFLAENEDDDE